MRIVGGTRREIQIDLDRNKLNQYTIPAVMIVEQIKNSGANIPIGKREHGDTETAFRALGRFETLKQIKDTLISFSGDIGNSVTVGSLGMVKDGNEEIKSIGRIYYPFEMLNPANVKKSYSSFERTSRSCLYLDVLKQSGSNTVSVAEAVKKKIEGINKTLPNHQGNPVLILSYDSSNDIIVNVDETKNAIIIGILMAIVVVYLFLGNFRSTIITGIAIPNSLLGAFLLMYVMDFSINTVTLLSLSLAIGLLVDDAIVVRENIYRKIEGGMKPFLAAEAGTREVLLAVIATTCTIVAVFLPIGFLEGVMGRFLKQFGLTVVFAMGISLFDAVAVAPFLSAHFAGHGGKAKNPVVRLFDSFQTRLDRVYAKIMRFCLVHPLIVMTLSIAVFAGSIGTIQLVKKTFEPEIDFGNFNIFIEMPSGTSLAGTDDTVRRIEDRLKAFPEINYFTSVVGNDDGESNIAIITVNMFPYEMRKHSTEELKEMARSMLREFPTVKNSVDSLGPGGLGLDMKPFTLVLKGEKIKVMEDYARSLIERLKKIPDLKEVESSIKNGKPELQIQFDQAKMSQFGITQKVAGAELRYHVAGAVVGKLHDKGLEYDVRMRLKPEQRDLRSTYAATRIPNVHFQMVPLSAVSETRNNLGPALILRQDRSRMVKISANLAPNGICQHRCRLN